MRLRDKFKKLKTRFKWATGYRFFYNKKSELELFTNNIAVFFLLYADDYGYSLMEIEFRRGTQRNSKMWWKWIKEVLVPDIMGKILENIYDKHGRQYRLVRVVGFSFDSVLHRGKHARRRGRYSKVSRRGSETIKAGR